MRLSRRPVAILPSRRVLLRSTLPRNLAVHLPCNLAVELRRALLPPGHRPAPSPTPASASALAGASTRAGFAAPQRAAHVFEEAVIS